MRIDRLAMRSAEMVLLALPLIHWLRKAELKR